MKSFLDEDFLLNSDIARELFHNHAKALPIIDYHCHLPPDQIAGNINFTTITQAWLNGDHYKWRAMRANGIDESYITGSKHDKEKFEQWAATVPYTLRNPLYHWTHLELQRYFDITSRLMPGTAEFIYDDCNAKLQSPQYSVQGLIHKMNVEVICTTDDPTDDLSQHEQLRKDGSKVKMYPAFRPDKAMYIEDVAGLNAYITKLEEVSNTSIINFNDYLHALKNRHHYFAANGCTVSDHGLEHVYAEEYTDEEIREIFEKVRAEKPVSNAEKVKFKSVMLYTFALWDHEKGWVQQFHLGALRNTNSRLLSKLGPDTGFDSIGDFSQARPLSKFLNRLDKEDRLAKTIIYNLNAADNEMMAAMIGNFNDGSVAGKVQFGSAWWFLDQKDGMTKQLNALSNMGLLSRFIGMLTDSRSFLSFPRHEYFRRILCNLFAEDIVNGELPNDIDWTAKVIKDICYFNAKTYFNFK
ncbi:glucuronate isomerase [Mucilaginibacter phyllosphaerae]